MATTEQQQDYLKWDQMVPRLDPAILEVIKNDFGFEKITKTQASVCPLFLSNKDVCVKACTGSGKTLAFGIPVIQTLLKFCAELRAEHAANNDDGDDNLKGDDAPVMVGKDQVIALLLAPSRELAIQIMAVLKKFEKLLPSLNFCYLIGGDKIDYDLQRIREKGANLVVATIGRLYDLAIEKKVLNFSKLEVLVMDEADKMMDKAHEVQMQSVLQLLPKQRRTGLFCATMPSSLKDFVRVGMRNPYFIDVKMEQQSGDIFERKDEGVGSTIVHALHSDNSSATRAFSQQESITKMSELPRGLKNYVHLVPSQRHKLTALLRFVDTLQAKRLIIFFGTCSSVNFH